MKARDFSHFYCPPKLELRLLLVKDSVRKCKWWLCSARRRNSFSNNFSLWSRKFHRHGNDLHKESNYSVIHFPPVVAGRGQGWTHSAFRWRGGRLLVIIIDIVGARRSVSFNQRILIWSPFLGMYTLSLSVLRTFEGTFCFHIPTGAVVVCCWRCDVWARSLTANQAWKFVAPWRFVHDFCLKKVTKNQLG